MTELDELTSKQQDLKTNLAKTSTLNFTALSLAVIALLIAAGFAFISTNRNTDLRAEVSRLSAQQAQVGHLDSQHRYDELAAKVESLSQHVSELASGKTTLLDTTEQQPISADKLNDLLEQQKNLLDRLERLERNAQQLSIKPAAQPKRAAQPRSHAQKAQDYSINIGAFQKAATAEKKAERLRNEGVTVDINEVVVDGKTWYRLTIPGFASMQEAQRFSETLKKQFGIKSVWIGVDQTWGRG
ncbi:SPOR domain-containing protein [Methylotuvimicrobium buryatense]|uniref:SPOR domain-containing protein n=1 Tax=Methylotuvimicrobium buryatense TaxID=95641 RepID=UPI00034B6114|nr:SPOR domain-containing protein [Methylotuvimicrobium buryatense]